MTYVEWMTHLTVLFAGLMFGIGISCWWFIRENKRLNADPTQLSLDYIRRFEMEDLFDPNSLVWENPPEALLKTGDLVMVNGRERKVRKAVYDQTGLVRLELDKEERPQEEGIRVGACLRIKPGTRLGGPGSLLP